MNSFDNYENLFGQYCGQSNYEQYCQVAHSDGHLDGDIAERHIDEYVDRA